ncbi:helix-turn-helix domain-containing protein [Nocardioides sp. AN3]
MAESTYPVSARVARAALVELDQTVTRSVDNTWASIPAYSGCGDPALHEDLRCHVDAVFRVILQTALDGREARSTDFRVTQQQATRRVDQGVGLADVLRAFRINQVMLWESLLCAASREARGSAAVGLLASHVMQVIEMGSSVLTDAYLDAQELNLADSDPALRVVIDELLAGNEPTDAEQRDLVRSAGLHPGTLYVVLSAVTCRDATRARIHDALRVLRPAITHRARGLVAVRDAEIVGVAPLAGTDVRHLIDAARRATDLAARADTDLSVGLSTVRTGFAEMRAAYDEAVSAREGLQGRVGVLALAELGTFDYLVLKAASHASPLVRQKVRRFVEQDRAQGSVLIDTLLAYTACDLNVRRTASQLNVHVNTARYRLDRIADRTHCDIRKFSDVVDLLSAVRMLGSTRVETSPPEGESHR